MAYKDIKTWLNENYGNKVNMSLDVNNDDSDTLMEFLRRSLRVSQGLTYDVSYDDPAYQKQLKWLASKFGNGFSNPAIPLFKIALIVKEIKDDLNYHYESMNDEFSNGLYVTKQCLGIQNDGLFDPYLTKMLFSNYSLNLAPDGDSGIREVAQKLNHYFFDEATELSNRFNLLPSDGVGDLKDYMLRIIVEYENRTGMKPLSQSIDEFLKIPDSEFPAYDSSKDSFTEPVQLAFYMRGFSSLTGRLYWWLYDGDAYAFNEIYKFKDFDPDKLTPEQIKTLFNPNEERGYSVLKLKRKLQSAMQKAYHDANFHLEYNHETEIGEVEGILPNGQIFKFSANILNGDEATNNFGSTENSVEDHKITLSYKNGKFDDISEELTKKFDSSVSGSISSVLNNTQHLVANMGVSNGKISVSVNVDSSSLTPISINQKIMPIEIDGKAVTMSTTVDLTFSIGMNVVTSLIDSNPDPQIQALNKSLADLKEGFDKIGMEVKVVAIASLVTLIFAKDIPIKAIEKLFTALVPAVLASV